MGTDLSDYLILYQNWLFDMPGRDESWTVYLKRLDHDLWHIIVDSTYYDGTPMEENEEYTLSNEELISWINERDSWLEGAELEEPGPELTELFEGYLDEDGEPFNPEFTMPHMRGMLLIAEDLHDRKLMKSLFDSCHCMTPEEYEVAVYQRLHPTYEPIPASAIVIRDAKYVNIRHFALGTRFFSLLKGEKVTFDMPYNGIAYYSEGWAIKSRRQKDIHFQPVRLEETTIKEMEKLSVEAKREYDLSYSNQSGKQGSQ